MSAAGHVRRDPFRVEQCTDGTGGVGEGAERGAVDKRCALVERFKPDDHAQCRGLPRSVRAEEASDCAIGGGETESVDSRRARIPFGQTLNVDHGFDIRAAERGKRRSAGVYPGVHLRVYAACLVAEQLARAHHTSAEGEENSVHAVA